jgi:hypothetical protein
MIHDPFVSNVEELAVAVVREADNPLNLFTSCDVVFTRRLPNVAGVSSRGTLIIDLWHALRQGSAYIEP